jgi:hypothetical protein
MAAPRLWGLACVRQGSDESRRGWWAGRGAPAPAAGFFSRPHGCRARSYEATVTSVQRPHAPRNEVVAATSCGSCWGPTCRRIHCREELLRWKGLAAKRSERTLGMWPRAGETHQLSGARGHTKPPMSLHRVPPRRKVGDSSGGRKPGAWGETRLGSGSGLLQPSSARLASRVGRDKVWRRCDTGTDDASARVGAGREGRPDDPAALPSIHRASVEVVASVTRRSIMPHGPSLRRRACR